MQNRIEKVISTAVKYGRFYCKFISANDVGLTGAHQEGLYIAKSAGAIFFPREGQKGENLENYIKIKLEDGSEVTSRAIWYGKGTRAEYRLTQFWAYTPYNRPEQVGNLIILVRCIENNYICFILEKEDDIDEFIDYFNINLFKGSAVYGLGDEIPETLSGKQLEEAIKQYASKFDSDFPVTVEIAEKARELFYSALKGNSKQPDNALLKWIEIEYDIFKAIEYSVYNPYLTKPFEDMENLISAANSILNRRKSRAGKSLEHHINFALTEYGIPFSHPGVTEGNKKPDFLLPSNEAYADPTFEIGNLTFLGAKTTCKDRWRQILNEADRIPEKHLLTLQQGISKNQLDEMKNEKVILVVPKAYHKMYPPEYQSELLDVGTFFTQMKEKYC